MSLLDDLLGDLDAETDQLRAVVADVADDVWATPTPAEGWTVATQVAHLAWTDETATTAAHSLAGVHQKEAWDAIVLQAIDDPFGFVDAGAHELAQLEPGLLLKRWDAAHEKLAEALRAVPDGEKMPWFGPPMSASSMVTARFMETWAHALDVYAALDVDPTITDRIKHVAHIGVRTCAFAFSVNEIDPPTHEIRVELAAPSGAQWTWGPEEAENRVTGPAYDFCLLVTQRVHRDDTALVAEGADANQWLDIAQCFAGPPGTGRSPHG